MDLLAKIKACQTMRELDELRCEIVKAAQANPSGFTTLQTTFIHKGNSLKRSGHTRSSEGYTLHEVIEESHKREET